MNKKYLLGLDLGTNSVGWCLTDENNNVIKKNGKSLWGVRLFEEAKNCKERRTHRNERRRLQRRKERIVLLRDLFDEEMCQLDRTFFQRLDESMLHKDDRTENNKYTLFIEKDFNDKTYYDRFPTIYHLRKYLLESNQKEDLRLIYLALAHMIKYRGHFLFEGDFKPLNKDDAKEIIGNINDLIMSLDDSSEENYSTLKFNDSIFEELKKINVETKGISKKKEEFSKILTDDSNNKFNKDVIIPLICGGSIKLVGKVLPKDSDLGDIKDSIDCKKENYEEIIENLKSSFESEETKLNILLECKKLYDFLLLGKLLGDEKYLSMAMVKRHARHHEELQMLKKYVKENYSDKYFAIFRDTSTNNPHNYAHYVGLNRTNGEGIRLEHCKQDEFYKFLRKTLEITDKSEGYLKEINDKMSAYEYLPRLNSADNGVFPHQLNEIEMKKILETQSKYYDFLNAEDEYGNVKDKIISILKYKIPYYVGPLNSNSKFAWIKRYSNEKIKPWNISKVVNMYETEKEFIQRMQSKCEYLHGFDCYCLPKNSIYFSYYCVLQELNKIRINGTFITVEQKDEILREVYLKHRKVTKKILLDWFKGKYGENVDITTASGKQLEELNASLASLIDFSNLYGLDYVKNNIDTIENIIKDIVIFEDKKILEQRLINEYGIEDSEIRKRIKGFTYKKYGRLSRQLLLLQGVDKNGELLPDNLLTHLHNSNYNLMELLNKKELGFGAAIDLRNEKECPNLYNQSLESYVNELYVSPGMKRPLIQAYKIIEELEKIVNHPIDEFYIETTRTNKAEKSRTDSRYKKIKKLYTEAKDFVSEELKKELELRYKTDPSIFNSDRVFLYFTQLGKCVYTGKPLDLETVLKSDDYDIDHIIPQCLIKDDSMNNKVLVLSSANRNKSDIYPVPFTKFDNSKNQIEYIKMLNKKNFISDDKKDRLLRRESLTSEELMGFVNRQLVYTSQSVKALMNLISNYHANKTGTNPLVVLSKAENVSDFRQKYDILKCRDANNYHHAHDAYLNVVVGRMVHTYFDYTTKEGQKNMYVEEKISKWIQENLDTNDSTKKKTTNISRIFDNDEKIDKKPVLDKEENIVWDYKNNATLLKTKDQINTKFDIMVTTRSYKKAVLFKKVGLKKASEYKNGNLLEKKKGLLAEKYGGYSDLSFGYYSLVESIDKKGHKQISLEAIPTMYGNDSQKKFNYILEKLELVEPKILVDELKINTVIKLNSSKFAITGNSDSRCLIKNLYEAKWSCNELSLIRKISKMVNLKEEKVDKDASEYIISQSRKTHKILKITKEECKIMYEAIEKQLDKTIYKGISSFVNMYKFINNEETKIKFLNLSLHQMCLVLYEMLKITKCNRETSNLKLIGGATNAGELRINKKIVSSIEIISESITGYYTKVIWSNK